MNKKLIVVLGALVLVGLLIFALQLQEETDQAGEQNEQVRVESAASEAPEPVTETAEVEESIQMETTEDTPQAEPDAAIEDQVQTEPEQETAPAPSAEQSGEKITESEAQKAASDYVRAAYNVGGDVAVSDSELTEREGKEVYKFTLVSVREYTVFVDAYNGQVVSADIK